MKPLHFSLLFMLPILLHFSCSAPQEATSNSNAIVRDYYGTWQSVNDWNEDEYYRLTFGDNNYLKAVKLIPGDDGFDSLPVPSDIGSNHYYHKSGYLTLSIWTCFDSICDNYYFNRYSYYEVCDDTLHFSEATIYTGNNQSLIGTWVKKRRRSCSSTGPKEICISRVDTLIFRDDNTYEYINPFIPMSHSFTYDDTILNFVHPGSEEYRDYYYTVDAGTLYMHCKTYPGVYNFVSPEKM